MLFELISSLPIDVKHEIGAVAFDGTSATSLLVDAATGRVLAPAKLYNEAQGQAAVDMAKVGVGRKRCGKAEEGGWGGQWGNLGAGGWGSNHMLLQGGCWRLLSCIMRP